MTGATCVPLAGIRPPEDYKAQKINKSVCNKVTF